MKNICDLHTHTVLSNHAYSSLTENIAAALKAGLKYYGISEHQCEDFGVGAKIDAFNALNSHTPRYIEDMMFLRGCEFNILPGGIIDPHGIKTERFDFGIASMHYFAYKTNMTKPEITQAYLDAIDYPFIKILGHVHEARYPAEYEPIVKKCKEKHVLIEINDSKINHPDLEMHQNNIVCAKELLEICKREQLPIILNSDAHICYHVGQIEAAEKMIEEIDYPRELILNYNEELFKEYILERRKNG